MGESERRENRRYVRETLARRDPGASLALESAVAGLAGPPPRLAITSGPHRCLRCGRGIRSRRSVIAGYGPRCAAFVGRAVASLEASGNDRAAKAASVLRDGGAVRTGHRGVWYVVSADGSHYYLTSLNGCTCKAGIHQVYCYHRVPVEILSAR